MKRSALWAELVIVTVFMYWTVHVRSYVARKMAQSGPLGITHCVPRVNGVLYPLLQILNSLRSLAVLAIFRRCFGARHHGFAAFLARSNCLKTAKLRRLTHPLLT